MTPDNKEKLFEKIKYTKINQNDSYFQLQDHQLDNSWSSRNFIRHFYRSSCALNRSWQTIDWRT